MGRLVTDRGNVMGFWLTVSHLVLAAVVLGLLLIARWNIKRRGGSCGSGY